MDDANTNKPLILVVDDESGIRMYLTLMLGKKGFRVIEAATGVEGYDKVIYEHPDLVILDIAMVGLTGTEVYLRMRADETTRNIPVLFCSALVLPPEVIVSRESRSDYIAKPFEFDALYQKVLDLLQAG